MKEKFRVGLINNAGIPKAENFETKKEAEEWILSVAETEGIRQAKLKDLETGIEERIF